MTITLDAISLVSLICGINMLYVTALSWIEGQSLLSSRLFSLLGLVGAWWALALSLAFSQWGMAWPPLLQLSQITSGFFGPLMLLYTLSVFGRLPRFDGRAWAIMATGLPGLVSIVLVLVLRPPHYDDISRAFIMGSGAFDVGAIAAEAPWYAPLQRLHALQLLANTLIAIGVALWAGVRRQVRRDRFEARLHAVMLAVLLVGIVLTNVLPGLGYPPWVARLAPVLPLPFMLTLWHFLRRRVDTAEALTRQREVLLTYLPSPSIDKLLGGDGEGRGRKVEAAVLFSDLRGFTSRSEIVEPEELVAWIDEFFSRSTRVILDELGMVDKLIGDAVLAVFGVPDWLDAPCERAVRAAQRMLGVIEDLNRERPLPGGPMKMGIGIHFGPLIAGTVGSSARRTYTVFGDTVNAASRVEGLTKDLGCTILITDAVRERLPPALADDFTFVEERVLRGRTRATALFGFGKMQS